MLVQFNHRALHKLTRAIARLPVSRHPTTDCRAFVPMSRLFILHSLPSVYSDCRTVLNLVPQLVIVVKITRQLHVQPPSPYLQPPTPNTLGTSSKQKKRCRPDYLGLANKTHGTVKQPVSLSSRDPIPASTTPGNFVSHKSKIASNQSFTIAGPSAGMLRGIQSAAFIEAMTTGIPRSKHITGLAMKGGL